MKVNLHVHFHIKIAINKIPVNRKFCILKFLRVSVFKHMGYIICPFHKYIKFKFMKIDFQKKNQSDYYTGNLKMTWVLSFYTSNCIECHFKIFPKILY